MYRDVEQSGQLSFVSIAHNHSYDSTYVQPGHDTNNAAG